MNAFQRMLGDKTVNGLATAVVVGMGTYSFVSYLGTTLSRMIFETGYSWDWDKFFSELLVYALVVLAGFWLYRQAK